MVKHDLSGATVSFGHKYTDLLKPEDISIAFLWTIFAGAVLDPEAPKVQRQEMRKAFYGGFVECFKIMVDLSDTLSDAEAAKVLDRLSRESHEFFEAMTKEMSA